MRSLWCKYLCIYLAYIYSDLTDLSKPALSLILEEEIDSSHSFLGGWVKVVL